MRLAIQRLLLSLGLAVLLGQIVCEAYYLPYPSCSKKEQPPSIEIGEKESWIDGAPPAEPRPLEPPPTAYNDCPDDAIDGDYDQGFFYEEPAGHFAAGFLHEFLPYNGEQCG